MVTNISGSSATAKKRSRTKNEERYIYDYIYSTESLIGHRVLSVAYSVAARATWALVASVSAL